MIDKVNTSVQPYLYEPEQDSDEEETPAEVTAVRMNQFLNGQLMNLCNCCTVFLELFCNNG